MIKNPSDELRAQLIAAKESMKKRNNPQKQPQRGPSAERVTLFERLAQPRIKYPEALPAREGETAKTEALL